MRRMNFEMPCELARNPRIAKCRLSVLMDGKMLNSVDVADFLDANGEFLEHSAEEIPTWEQIEAHARTLP